MSRTDALSAVTGRLRELAEKATPGPWEYRVWGTPADDWPQRRVSVGRATQLGEAITVSPRYVEQKNAEANAAFIAAASPEVVLALCDVTDALEEVREVARWYAEEHAGPDLEVHHALKVEVLCLAEDALARLSAAGSATPKEAGRE